MPSGLWQRKVRWKDADACSVLLLAVMTAEDIITVSHEGDVIGGGKAGRRVVNKAGFLVRLYGSRNRRGASRDSETDEKAPPAVLQIHSSIHSARPDVQAICHSHSPYGKAWSTLGLPVSPSRCSTAS